MSIESAVEESDEGATTSNAAYSGGFVTGLLTARFWHLRNSTMDEFFRSAIPSETPDIVYALLSNMCRAAIDERLFATGGFRDIDALLLCDTTRELHALMSTLPDCRIQ